MKYQRHFFVCTNQRPPFAKPSCGARGSNKIFMMMLEEMEQRNLVGQVGVTETGCLGPCDRGSVMVVYPDQVWYTDVKEEDVKEICESHMQNGKPVERLVYKWPAN
jgi:(2Fe-2S) ferredoxin